MPHFVGNNIIVTGTEIEISRFVDRCFRPDETDDDSSVDVRSLPEFWFGAVIPIDAALKTEAGIHDPDTVCSELWGTRREALETTVLHRAPGLLHFEFLTMSGFPEPVYRELGRLFPALKFDVAAMNSGEWWAVAGQVVGERAIFDEVDCREVFERIYKEPLDDVLQQADG